jgi:hypothetical protein
MTEFDGLKVARLPQASFWSPVSYTGMYGIKTRTVCRPVSPQIPNFYSRILYGRNRIR